MRIQNFMFDELDPMEEFQHDLSMMADESESLEELPDEVHDIESNEYDFPATASDGDSLEHATLECMECGRKFKSANTEDPTCPTCGSEDLELE